MSDGRQRTAREEVAFDDPSVRLAVLLREMRSTSGKSLRELQRHTHASDSSLSRYLTGRSFPPWSVVQALCELVGRDPGELRPVWDAVRQERARVAGPAIRNDLPRDTLRFVGRATEIAALLAEPGPWALHGMAGVGKTALAVHAAHRMADTHPDGQFYVNLHGHTDGRAPLEPDAALETLLRAIGLPSGRIPEDRDERAALWRAELARRHSVVVLDNAAQAAQIRPLLPGTATTTMIITSRRRMTDLDDVRQISLDVLAPAEATDLFAAVAGVGMAAAEPQACREIVQLCGYLPLAVRICAARLHHRPAWTAEHLLGRLHEQSRRLAELDAGDGRLGAALALSAAQLDKPTRRVFSLLGSAPGPDVDAYLTAALADCSLEQAEQFLEDLVDVHLLELPALGRYRLHDLTRDYARGSEVAERDLAQHRMFDYYLYCAVLATQLFDPYQAARGTTAHVTYPPAHVPALTTSGQAAAWLEGELSNLINAARAALTSGARQQTVALARKVNRFFLIHGHTREWITMSELALQAAQQTGAHNDQAWASLALGAAYRRLGQLPQALACLQSGRELAREHGLLQDEGYILNALAIVHADLWQLDAAIGNYLAAVEFFQDTDNSRGTALAKANLAEILLRRNREGEALEHARTALDMFETELNHAGATRALAILGDIHRCLGEYDTAIDRYRCALQRACQLGFREMETAAQHGLALAYHDSGDLVTALVHHDQVSQLVAAADGHPREADFLNDRARTNLAADRIDECALDCKQALEIAKDRNNPYERARALQTIAALTRPLDPAMADRVLAEAMEIFSGLGVETKPV